MTAIFVKTDEPSAPAANTPYVEKDWAIIRGVTLGAFDWSNSETYALTGAIPGTATFGNLVAGGSNGTISPANAGATFPAVSGGLLNAQGATNAGGLPVVRLPSSFTFGAGVTRSLLTFWAKLPATGYLASNLPGLIGSGTGANASLQYTCLLIVNGSGAATQLTYRVRGTSGNIDASITGAALAALLDGNLHQIGLGLVIASGTGTVTLFVDGVAVATGSGSMSSYNVIGPASLFIGSGGNQLTSSANTNALLGRPFAHDLTSRPDISFEDILARDAESAEGYLS